MTNTHSPSSALPENAHVPASAPGSAADSGPDTAPDTPLDNNAPDYNSEDYRWVPVRRRPRYDGWTEEKQRRFIEVLADTGIVTVAAKAVGMSRESANRLRRSPHGDAFARAWDAARHHAGSVLEDIAFERAIEGVEHNVYDEYGEVVCTKRVYNDRLLTFLLGALKPERYGRHAQQLSAQPGPEKPVTLDASLRAMEPQLPAPVEELLGAQTLNDELDIADSADGTLPNFLFEARPVKSAARQEAEAVAAQYERGKAACEKMDQRDQGEGGLNEEEFKDMCLYLDPTQRTERGKKRFR